MKNSIWRMIILSEIFFSNSDFENAFRDCLFENDGNSLRDHVVENDVKEIICLKNDGFLWSHVYICAQTSLAAVSINVYAI